MQTFLPLSKPLMNVITGEKASELENSTTAPAKHNNLNSSYEPPVVPDKPLVVLEPQRAWVNIGFRELWAYRELLFFLIWRDVKVRYKQTALGVAWAIIQPLFTMLIFTIFFGRLAGLPSDNLPYPIFAFAGLLPWTFFTNAVTASGNSLVGSANLITKVYFPRMIVPAASVGAGLVDFAIAFLVFIPMMVYYGVAPTWQLLMLVPLLILATLLALGVGMWMSAMNVKYRDIRYALPFLMQLWMFVSPIIYPASLLKNWRWLLAFNPLTGIIEGFRSALLARPFGWFSIAVSAAITFAVLLFATYSFRRMEKRFADIV
jgi:homopolymeric O-antigen transport system permease protein